MTHSTPHLSAAHAIGTALLAVGLLNGCATLTGADAPATEEVTTGAKSAAAIRVIDDAARTAAITSLPDAFARDRAAILAMQGDYQVDFHFQETVPLKPAYARRQEKTSGAFETVQVIADTGRRIVLQHLLVGAENGQVIKHWRQDWEYEAPQRWEFSAEQTWRIRPLEPALTAGAWTQCVYEVSDAPRYCGTGRWNHRYGNPTWTSDRSWRPLPRREYTQRDDYNALNVENRHTITAQGWAHEQDNTKVVRQGERTVATLVREFGYNDYRRIEGFDFSPAHRYWEATADYWAQVRAAWAERITQAEGIVLKTSVDGMAIIGALFAQAAQVQSGQTVSRAEIDAVLDQWTGPPATQTAARSR